MERRPLTIVVALVATVALIALATPVAAAEVQVTIVNFAYDPDPVQVGAGDTITWVNNDPGPHTVSANDGSFSAYLNAGESFSMTVGEDGEIGYYCKLHGAPGQGMAGTILVGAQEGPAPEDLPAGDNVASSVAWSRSNYPDGAPFAVLSRADLFADSLASGGVQGKLDAPLLLTPPGSLDPRVTAELDRLGTRRVTIMGGTAAISPSVEQALRSRGYGVDRVAGADRIGTALAAAQAFNPEARSALLARATGKGTRSFADALSAGALAASSGQPVLFSASTALTPSVGDYIASHGMDQVTLIGGEAALSTAVEEAVAATGASTERLAGADRFGTAAMVAERTFSDDTDHLAVIDGVDPDAWADGFPAASRRAPILLANGDDLPPPTAGLLLGGGPPVICGTSLSGAACARANELQTISFDLPAVAAAFKDLDTAIGLYTTAGATTICYDAFPPAPITSASLQSTSGTELLKLSFGTGPFGDPFGCSFGVSPGLVANLLANPGDHQLAAGGSVAPVIPVDLIGISEMLGEAEVPGPGDPDAFAIGFVVRGATPAELCVVLAVFAPTSSPVTAAHIHQGAPSAAGPPVVTLDPPTDGASVACYAPGEALVNAMAADPGAYYINIHTESHPDGAVRGQLFNPFG
jgi:putative cell wall-binding protein